MTERIWPKDINWVLRPIIKMHDNPPPESQWEYHVWLPDFLAEWDIFGDWEVERLNSMRDNLKKGDVLLDIGTEIGWMNIIFGQIVGAQNMVLIEPSSDYWPNIKAIWRKNFPKTDPLQCHYGLIGDKTTGNFVLPRHLYPAEAENELTKQMVYRSITEHGKRMPTITIDDFVKLTRIKPDALTIDTEGSELPILRGAKNTLKARNLKVWVSIHPDLSEKYHGDTAGDLHKFMKRLGYSGKHLATDHEEHWYFTKAKK